MYTVSQKNIQNIFDCNLKKDCQILIIFGDNISETAGHRIIVYYPTSPIVYFCTTLGDQNRQNIAFFT